MKRDVKDEGGIVTVKAKPVDAAARVRGLAEKRAEGKKVTLEEVSDQVLAIMQYLGIDRG